MTHKQYVDTAIANIRDEWFKDHVAKLENYMASPEASPITRILWAKPGTMTCGITYLIYRNSLIVLGDLGTATYTWSELIDMKFIAECNWDYMSGKMEGLEGGERPEEWNDEVAESRFLDQMREEALEDGNPVDRGKILADKEALSALIDKHIIDVVGLDECRQGHTWTSEGWSSYLADSSQECFERFSDIGKVPSMRFLSHWLGIRMAYEQLCSKHTEEA